MPLKLFYIRLYLPITLDTSFTFIFTEIPFVQLLDPTPPPPYSIMLYARHHQSNIIVQVELRRHLFMLINITETKVSLMSSIIPRKQGL